MMMLTVDQLPYVSLLCRQSFFVSKFSFARYGTLHLLFDYICFSTPLRRATQRLRTPLQRTAWLFLLSL
ncbi:Hypothetical protein, putative [Bodo saltans]|uniref:Uncharacterized protein n=1 Tax=Bodo saltans TaxID=75058 RepID=A0A0S4JX19_BODSA|nr:Hypothetical protein, putative [Bodo saltans]|eukprot:CUG93989.1 Hypothetical protein, putative [Bodo saltans]